LFNLQKKKLDFSNDNGQYIEVDHESFPPLEIQDVVITLTRIEQVSVQDVAECLFYYLCS